MAKQPVSVIADNPRQNRLVVIVISGLAIAALVFLGFSQLTNVHAQTATPTLNFGNQTVGTQSGTQNAVFSVSDTLTTTYNVNTNFNVDANFTVVNNGCNDVNVPPGGSCSVTVMFNPQTAGPHTGSITFDYSPIALGINPQESGAVINSEGGSKVSLTNSLNAPAQQVPSATTTLTGVGVAPTTFAPSPSPTLVITTTRAPSQPSCGSQIQGYVLIDGQPGAGVVVNLSGASKNSVTIGSGGYFYFNNLCAGDYTIALDYDHTKYKANDPDVRQIKLDGNNPSRNNAFSLSTIPTTTAAPTTAAPTTASPTTAAPTTAAVTTTPPASVPACNLPSGTVLRVCTATTQQDPTHFALVVKVAAGDSPVDLNDTVIVNLPAGTVVTSASSGVGAVTVTSNNTVRWGSFSLSPKQSANLVLSIDAPNGNLNGSSLFVSGSFNRSQAFQQRIPGLPGLVDIVPAAPQNTGNGTGGQGGGASVPSQAPATGAGQDNTQDTPVVWLILAAIVAGAMGIFGLFLTGRGRKPDRKEQK